MNIHPKILEARIKRLEALIAKYMVYLPRALRRELNELMNTQDDVANG